MATTSRPGIKSMLLLGDLITRLSQLEQVARKQSLLADPKRVLTFTGSAPAREQRLLELWNEFDGELTATEMEELYAILGTCVTMRRVKIHSNPRAYCHL